MIMVVIMDFYLCLKKIKIVKNEKTIIKDLKVRKKYLIKYSFCL